MMSTVLHYASITPEGLRSLLREARGTSSIAHPGANKVQRGEVRILAELGLDAVEAEHPEHVPTQVEAYVRWAEEHSLLITGGSDYHGPAVQLDLFA